MSERLALELEPADTLRLANLCGQFDEHLKQIESRLGVEIFCRGWRRGGRKSKTIENDTVESDES